MKNQTNSFKTVPALTLIGTLLFSSLTVAQASTTMFSGSGANTASVFADFQAAIGGGSRIAWDGVRLDGTDANPNTRVIDQGKTVEIPVDRFRNVGAIYADPYAVSGDGFNSVSPVTVGQFTAFSPTNTFAMFDPNDGQFEDRFIEQTFVVPGTNISALSKGFGAIFTDVELAGTSSIEYFGQQGVSLGKYEVPVGASGETQFLGVLFDQPIIESVKLTLGTHAAFSFDGSVVKSLELAEGMDLAATDDFLFATPVAPVPLPAAVWLFGSALMGMLGLHKRKASI
jgi:hypothetical protein